MHVESGERVDVVITKGRQNKKCLPFVNIAYSLNICSVYSKVAISNKVSN